VWVRGAAIRPVPSYAVVDVHVLEQVEDELGSERAKVELDAAFLRFERTQPHVAGLVSEVLDRPLDETALALGYFLSIAVWLGFERAFRDRLGTVNEDALKATEAAILLAEGAAERDVDVDDVHLVYRTILVLTLALSHAVAPEGGDAGPTPEMQA